MKKFGIIILLALVASLSASAQLLWRVTSPASQKTSYIVGTHHVAPPYMLDSIKGLTAAIEAVDKVIGEIDMTDLTAMEVQQATLPHMIAPADSTLDKLFTPAQLDSIGKVLAEYTGGMVTIEQLYPMKPMAVSQTIAMLQAQKAFPGFDPTQQLDTRIQAIAKAGGKAIGGFETIEFQLATLFDTPLANQANDLMDAIRNDATAIADAKRLADTYVAGDIDALYTMLTEGSSKLDDEARYRLLDGRNADWAEKLSLILPNEQVLVSVGCGHLPGPDGLISLLRKQGYTVEPVTSDR